MDSVEMPHFRQRSFLPSQPVRRTPILHNFLHILSSRSPGAQTGAEQSRPLSENGSGVGESPSMPLPQYPSSERGPPFPGCTQHLGMVCLCSRCSVNRSPSLAPSVTPSDPRVSSDPPQPPPASTFSSARTEPRQPSERPSAFTSVYYSAGTSLNPTAPSGIEPHSTTRPGPDWTRNLLSMREGGVGPGMLPPRTSSSSISLLSVLRQQDGSSQSPVYTSASEGRGFPQQGDPGARDTAGTSSGHHPFWDGSRSNTASFRNVLQCNLSRYFMEFDRMQDLEPPLGGSMADGGQEQSQELLNNNMDPERPGPSSSSSTSSPTIIHYQPPLPPPPSSHSLENNVPPPASRGHLNRCRACHNLLTFNHDSQRWERTSQSSSTSASSLEPSSSSSSFPPSSSPWQPEEGRRTLEAQPPERRAPPEPSEQLPPPGAGGAATVAFPIGPTPSQTGEQTVGLVYNQDTAQWERVYRQAAAGRSGEPPEALSQEMPVDPPDEDSLRRYRLFVSSLWLSVAFSCGNQF